MPVTWHLDESSLLHVTGTGAVTDEEYLEAHRGFMAATADLPVPRRTIADWSAVTSMELSSAAIRTSAGVTTDEMRIREGEHRIALVAATPVVFGMSRMWQTLISDSGVECTVVSTREEALAWLER
jgi:hypothetical protein